jgi:hypothetical protein
MNKKNPLVKSDESEVLKRMLNTPPVTQKDKKEQLKKTDETKKK